MTLATRAIALAAAEPVVEVCGLLLGRNGRVETLTVCVNVAADLRTGFEIDPAALIAAHRAARAGGPQLLGCWHSHPTGSALPSARDLASAQPGRLWLIVTAHEARLFLRDLNGFVERPIG